MDIFDRAITFAIKAHEGQKRKNGGPFIVHPIEVAAIAASMTTDLEILSAAVLHDTVEDTEVNMDDILREFGERVTELVSSETEDKRQDQPPEDTWRIRKEESISILKTTDDNGIRILWLSDKLSNMRSFYLDYKEKGDALWQNFHQKNPEAQHWYYRTVAEYLDCLSETPAWQEYDRLVYEVFEKDNKSGGKL